MVPCLLFLKLHQQLLSLPNRESPAWAELLPFGLSSHKLPIPNQWDFTILSRGVFDFWKSWNCSSVWNYYYNTRQFMLFAPIISPGYAGDAPNNNGNNNGALLKTVIATGDLVGNYSVSNTSNPYIPSTASATTYDGFSLSNGMSYFQLFAQNMQWFSLQVPLQTPLVPLSTPQNVTPGQGIFSDAIQMAAMQAPATNNTTVPVFTGSVGVTAGITGPIMMSGAAPVIGGGTQHFIVPQAFLSELTVNSFKVGRYLQVPLGTQMNGTWSGGLVQLASEDPLQYYQGVTPVGSKLNLMPYLPVYSSDPGRPVDQPGWNYCPLANFNETSNAQMCYDTAASPMTNFYTALNGTR